MRSTTRACYLSTAPMLLALATLFGFGLVHGLGPDHCLAITALATGADLRGAVSVSLRFGAGHAIILALGTLAAIALGFTVPQRWEAALEALGGVCLVALGLWTVFAKGPIDIPHVHLPGTVAHDHPDAPTADRSKGPWSLGLGAIFGLSGVRGLLLVIPLVARRNVLVALAGVALFGVGVALSMLAVGLMARSATRLAGHAGGLLRTIVGGAATLVGVYWILGHVR